MIDKERLENLQKDLLEKSKLAPLTTEEDWASSRIDNVLTALRLKLNYFMYAGGKTNGSFCTDKNSNVFSLADLDRWAQENKNKFKDTYDVIMYLGGTDCSSYDKHCRHSFNFISESLAKRHFQNNK